VYIDWVYYKPFDVSHMPAACFLYPTHNHAFCLRFTSAGFFFVPKHAC
jgi:hypothetical protein